VYGPSRVEKNLLIFLTTLALSVYLFVIIPKGFFPQQDTGLITGISEAAQGISFADMTRHQETLGEIVRAPRTRIKSSHDWARSLPKSKARGYSFNPCKT
jgi:multidrug efflux pump subunit AcrB